MMKPDTDEEWEEWGKKNPYYGVIVLDKYRRENIDDSAYQDFFDSGRTHVESVLRACRDFLDPGFSPTSALDFGCGTGRLLIPMAEAFESATGLDVSDSMLAEAQRNCEKFAVKNVSLIKSDDELGRLDGSFDLIHSYIVFQHIPVDRGERIFIRLLEHLSDGGIGALHFTYGKSHLGDSGGYPLPSLRRSLRRRAREMKREGARRLRSLVARALPDGEIADPEMQMNSYLLNRILFHVQALGVRKLHLELTDHDGDLGVYVYFQKPALAE